MYKTTSIVYWGYQDNFKPVYLFIYFFWEKDFARTKRRHTLEVYTRVKNCCLCCLVLAYFCFSLLILLVTCFCAREIFSLKKIIKSLEIVLITSIYNTTVFKNDEKCFLFHLKNPFVLKILKFLSWYFGHLEKRLD